VHEHGANLVARGGVWDEGGDPRQLVPVHVADLVALLLITSRFVSFHAPVRNYEGDRSAALIYVPNRWPSAL
jgi:hypothetical protein